jgi:nitrate/nitrite transporter NarK
MYSNMMTVIHYMHFSPEKKNINTDKSVEKPKRNILKFEKDLLIYKIFYFGFGGAIGCVFPFLSVYYKQLGFSPNQIGIISGVRPLIGFMSGPVWGSIADRCRIRKMMMLISTFGWLIFLLGIGFVPPAPVTMQLTTIQIQMRPSISGSHTYQRSLCQYVLNIRSQKGQIMATVQFLLE